MHTTSLHLRSENSGGVVVPSGRPVVAVTYRGLGSQPDAILAYSANLAKSLCDTGDAVGTLVTSTPAATWAVSGGPVAADLPSAVEGARWVLLQYNPFSYGHWGVAPWLLKDLHRLRRRGTPMAVMVHEAFLSPTNSRQRLLRTWQRTQLKAILDRAEMAFAATESLAECVRELRPELAVHHAPVGSNFPDRRADRAATRARLGLGEDELALVAFGTGHPSQLSAWVALAANVVANVAPGGVILNLGAGAHPVPDVPEGMRVLTPGSLEASELAGWLAAGDLFVAPFSDGVSTRRTTVMAALQHELPVVTTRGHSTDALLREAEGALELVDAGAPAVFAQAVERLARDQAARQALGAAGRRFFEKHFDWPVIAATFVDSLIGARHAAEGSELKPVAP